MTEAEVRMLPVGALIRLRGCHYVVLDFLFDPKLWVVIERDRRELERFDPFPPPVRRPNDPLVTGPKNLENARRIA